MSKQKLPDCELEIMNIIWKFGPDISQPKIKEQLEEQNQRSYGKTTICTWLTRLKHKNFVTSYMKGGISYYSASISQADYEEMEISLFTKRLFNGSMSKLFLAFSHSKELTKEDVKEIKELLDEWDS